MDAANMSAVSNARTSSTSRDHPDIDRMLESTLPTQRQLVGLTGFNGEAFKKWAREGCGPAIVFIEGRPRTTVRDYRAWIAGQSVKPDAFA